MIDDLDNVDFISSNVNSSRQEALLYIFEDNEAVIKMIIKGRSPTMRHVSRTHRVALDWLLDRINFGPPKSKIKYIDTKNQLADMLTKGNFTRDEWKHLLCLFNTSHCSSINWLEVMSKRTQEDAGEERVTTKSKPMMNLLSRYRVRDPNVLASTASERPVKTKSESQNVRLGGTPLDPLLFFFPPFFSCALFKNIFRFFFIFHQFYSFFIFLNFFHFVFFCILLKKTFFQRSSMQYRFRPSVVS